MSEPTMSEEILAALAAANADYARQAEALADLSAQLVAAESERDAANADAEALAELIRTAALIDYDAEARRWRTYAVNKLAADAALAAHDERLR